MQLPGVTLEQAIQYFVTLLNETDSEDKIAQAANILLALHRLGNVGRGNLLRCLSGERSALTDEEFARIVEAVQTSNVYVLADDRGYHKIGKADDPDRRRQNVSTGTPGGAQLVDFVVCPTGRAFEVENQAKTMLDGQRLPSGEWFACDEQTAKAILRRAWREIYGADYEDFVASAAPI